MQSLTEKIWKLAPVDGVFNDTIISNLFPNYSNDAIKGLIRRAIHNKEILLIRRGLYCLAEDYRSSNPHPFSLAHLIHGPSYVSFESSLWFHELIPEALQQVSSVTSQRSRNFKTPFGYYFYYRVPCRDLMTGVELIKVNESSWSFIAKPIRAIADLIYLRKEVTWKKHGISFLTESLRIEPEDLQAQLAGDFDSVIQTFRSRRVQTYIRRLKKELKT